LGSWNESCGITQLPINSGDKIRAFILVDNTYKGKVRGGGNYYPYDEWMPLGISVPGTYDDYGGMENIVENETTHLMLDLLKEGWSIDGEDKSRYNIPDTSKLKLADVLNGVERDAAKYSTLCRKNRTLGIMYVLEEVYQSIMEFNPIGVHYTEPEFQYKPEKTIFIEELKEWYEQSLSHFANLPHGDDKTRLFCRMATADIFYAHHRDNELIHILRTKFVELIEAGVPFDDARVQAWCNPLWEMSHFQITIMRARKFWHPQSGKGSQNQDLDIHKKLLEAATCVIMKREMESEEDGLDKPDENGYYPYMLKQNAKVHSKM
jgi:hypothetical protein